MARAVCADGTNASFAVGGYHGAIGTVTPGSEATPTVIVDCDPGIDDALALLMLVAAQQAGSIAIEAVFTVAGNVSAEQTAHNAVQVLASTGADDIAVFRGASRPLGDGGPALPAASIHGEDGLGGLSAPTLDAAEISYDPGKDLAERIGSCSQPLWLFCSGPLTNLALALKADAKAVHRAARVVVMGGAFKDPTGNITPWAEFNFHADPVAADIVCRSGLSLELVPLDITHRVGFASEDASPLTPFAGELLQRSVQLHERALGLPGALLHDAVAAAVLLRPVLASRVARSLAVTTSGPRSGHLSVQENVSDDASRVIDRIDVQGTKQLIQALLT